LTDGSGVLELLYRARKSSEAGHFLVHSAGIRKLQYNVEVTPNQRDRVTERATMRLQEFFAELGVGRNRYTQTSLSLLKVTHTSHQLFGGEVTYQRAIDNGEELFDVAKRGSQNKHDFHRGVIDRTKHTTVRLIRP